MSEISVTNFDCKDSIFLDTAKIYNIFFALKYKIMGTRKRFYEVRDALNLTDYKIQTSIEGITKSMLDKLRQGIVTEISIKILKPFIEAYPQVNANYILTGRGSMFIQEQESDNSASMLEEAHRNLEDAMAEIKRLKEENELLRTAFTRLQSS
jgi:hypothetical protein